MSSDFYWSRAHDYGYGKCYCSDNFKNYEMVTHPHAHLQWMCLKIQLKNKAKKSNYAWSDIHYFILMSKISFQ